MLHGKQAWYCVNDVAVVFVVVVVVVVALVVDVFFVEMSKRH